MKYVFAFANRAYGKDAFAFANKNAMEYISAKEAAEKWGVTARRVQILCSQNRIAGVTRFGNRLMIPANATYPVQKNTDLQRAKEQIIPLPRKTPFLHMSDLYSIPGTADEAAKGLSDNLEAQILFDASIAYSRGQINKVYEQANFLLEKHSGYYAVLSSGMLLALCAIWRGDLNLWNKAKIHITEAPMKSELDQQVVSLAISAMDSILYDIQNFPDWFKIGNFELLPADALPAAKVYYAKYLYAAAYAVATKQYDLDGIQGLSLMNMLPYTFEPMISQARADKSIVVEIYLRMINAVVYHNIQNEKESIRHLDQAIALALPDKLYGILAEYCRLIGMLLKSRLELVDPEAWQEVDRLYKIYNVGWSKLSSIVRNRQIITTLSPQYREVAKLAAYGLSNTEIAQRMHMSLAGVKQAIRIISEKSGVERKEFATIL